MRGIPVMASGSGRRPWISPAHAGNTRRPGGERRRQPDQPRTCGEYGVSGRACSRLRDQPRTCGEYHSPARAGLTGMGSAPHMRGIHGEVARGLSHVRISPAHAGNTGVYNPRWIGVSDQPRTCGEYRPALRRRIMGGGSAPHMRGIPALAGFWGLLCGISPAHAGNTCVGGILGFAMWDQPRTCGEYGSFRRDRFPPRGSAPHMRGIQLPISRSDGPTRISPAHAGNTGVSGGADPRCGDQPRTCGEYMRSRCASGGLGGSAPHMRGIRGSGMMRRVIFRISPAHAGNTPQRERERWGGISPAHAGNTPSRSLSAAE